MSRERELDPLIDTLGDALGVSPAEIKREIDARIARAARRAQRANARYDDALSRITAAQRTTIDALKRDGARQQSRLRQDRETGNVAIILQKTAFDSRRGRMGVKLLRRVP